MSRGLLEGELKQVGIKPRKGERILGERAKRIALVRERRTRIGGEWGKEREKENYERIR